MELWRAVGCLLFAIKLYRTLNIYIIYCQQAHTLRRRNGDISTPEVDKPLPPLLHSSFQIQTPRETKRNAKNMTVPMILCVKTRSLASNQILSRSQRNSKTSLRRRTFPTGQMRKSSVEVATIFTMLLLLLLLLVERKYTHSWQSLSLHPARKRLPVRSNHASPSEIVLRTQHHLHDFGTSNSEPLDSTRTTALSSTTAGISSTTSSSARMPGHPLQTSPTYDNGDAVSLHLRGEEIDLRSGAPTVFGQETCHGDYRTETNDDNDSLRPAQFQMPSAETNDSSAQNMESIVNRDVHFGIDYKTATTISPSVGRMDLTAEAAVSSVLNSVSHWCDIMRQKGSWLPSDTSNEDNKADGDKRDDNSTNQNLGGSSHTSTTLGLRLDSVLSDPDMSSIEGYWDCIMPTVSYLGTVQVSKIYKALCVAYQAHRGQIRKSGEPFIVHVSWFVYMVHEYFSKSIRLTLVACVPNVYLICCMQPVEVALLLSGLKMDAETVMAGLLHDTVEDTELTFAQVESLFGVTVRSIVEGETKVSKLPKQLAFSEYADEQAENLRQMFVAMTDDYRIIIVKLADRLHNMRTLKYMKPEKQIMISRETLDIFAPLAHRMGIWQFKSELEDTAFMYLYPVEYKRLDRRLQQHHKKFKDTLDKSQELLQRRLNNDPTLKQQAAKVEVFGRRKEIYSLWHKMETKKEHNLENILDVVALRVIITPLSPKSDDPENDTDRGVWLCYHVLGLVQHLHGFQPVPTKVKDYISFPVRDWL